ncbi:MAG TPA: DNA polymerase domain-containing protein [Deinococcales bacterium]|nr:DNA polymerase domain-containing protein [Deinococcales bacterium]
MDDANRTLEWLFGWDTTPGIVSVHAEAGGSVIVWRQVGERVVAERERFRPWLLAAHLDDLPPGSLGEDGSSAPFAVRRLEGEGAYPYLVSARNGRALERAVLDGAAARLGTRPDGVASLPDYYRVGWVEQYLMASGRVCFRELKFDDLHRLQFDLETTGFGPREGRIFMAAVRDNRGFERVLEAARPQDEAALIAELCAIVRERDPTVVENHNLNGFDFPFLEGRAAALGVPLQLGRDPGPPELTRTGTGRDQRYCLAGREVLDTLDAVRRYDFSARDMPGHGLKDAARYFGIADAERVYIPGAEIASTYARDPERVRRYALFDVREVDGISRILHASAFALAQMAPRRLERLSTAGPATGILEPMLVRAYLREGQALPASADSGSNGRHSGGATILYASGVAERVVKADVASLYPSLIRAFRIGPSRDRLGVFVSLVDRLTALRLEHKRLGRAGGEDSAPHAAVAAAMKIVVNSAYGYLGAGRLALFADRRAADEVTARGRHVLERVCRELQQRAVTLIEADTDGVYFAVPEDWDDARVLAVIGEVSATLPPGVNLEFDGRYAVMYSHEVKNYALLTQSGKLIVRGGALRSSRSEPFGEAFLERALACLLRFDVAGVRAAYLEAAERLESRSLAAYEVSTRARLTKTPEQYAASPRSEAPYEALLAAGRTRWHPWDRVRYYRAEGGRYVLLPADWEEARAFPARDYDVRHYRRVLLESFAQRLRKAFREEDFERVFRDGEQESLFDAPLSEVRVVRIS